MSKVIYTIQLLIILCLVSASDSKSQDKNIDSSNLSKEITEADTNLQNKLFILYQNEETESNEVILIKFNLIKAAVVILNVIDSNGKVIDYLVDGEMLPGTYCVHFKPTEITALKDFSYKIEVNGVTETRKISEQ
ncbi:MAG TPA: hypothetical protein PK294_01190 [Ignavibacteria bacterium]|nr:hypothetical protein [Ignavibacteria bacterium]